MDNTYLKPTFWNLQCLASLVPRSLYIETFQNSASHTEGSILLQWYPVNSPRMGVSYRGVGSTARCRIWRLSGGCEVTVRLRNEDSGRADLQVSTTYYKNAGWWGDQRRMKGLGTYPLWGNSNQRTDFSNELNQTNSITGGFLESRPCPVRRLTCQ